MTFLQIIKYNVLKIFAITEKNIKLSLRFKFVIIFGFISPVLSIIMPLIIMSAIFKFNSRYGPWTSENFIVYQFIACNIMLLKGIIEAYPGQFTEEKFWQTLPGLIIAPSNRFNLLLGIFFAHLILISFPFTFFFILCYIYYPISFFSVISVIVIFLLIALIFSGIGLVLGVFAISNENINTLLSYSLNIFFLFSCISYPYDLFPDFVQKVIDLNPLYYIFDILRIVWIENMILKSIILHPIHFLILIIIAIIIPLIGVIVFNKVYKKFGIVGS